MFDVHDSIPFDFCLTMCNSTNRMSSLLFLLTASRHRMQLGNAGHRCTLICPLLLLFVLLVGSNSSETTTIDENGYVVYCPCMGRFGNQADQFLGVLSFAWGLNRTHVLPPWVEYRPGHAHSVQVPFDTYFRIEPLQKYHRVITMEKFMIEIAPIIWPPGKRIVFCDNSWRDDQDCNANEGNPFNLFWDTFGVEFDGCEFYKPLHYNVHHGDIAGKWKKKYPPEKYPVLAFPGAPGSFPVQKENIELQQYLVWNDDMVQKAMMFVKATLPKGPFIGIHLRNGIDWWRACEDIEHTPLPLAAPQCLGYNKEKGIATPELCFPTDEIILRQLKRTVKAIKARAVFVASDNDYMIDKIKKALKTLKVNAYKLDSPDPHIDLIILGKANHFIGNCISSFTAFVKRQRDVLGLPSSFWAFPLPLQHHQQRHHDEF